MELEIVDYVTKQVYTGKEGICFRADNGVCVDVLKTVDGEYIVEQSRYYEQICIIPNIKTEQDALIIVHSLLPLEHMEKILSLKIEGQKYINLEKQNPKSLKELTKEFLKDSPIPDITSRYTLEVIKPTAPLMGYSKLDSEIMLRLHQSMSEDTK